MSGAYSHDPVVLTQLAKCRRLPLSALLKQIDEGDQFGEKIKEETLVILAREYRHTGKDRIAWKIVQTLSERVKPSILRSVQLWRLTPVVAEEFIESILSTLYEVILGDQDIDRFWEVKFWVCFERRLITALKRYRIQDDRYVSVDAPVDDRVELSTGYDQLNPELRALMADGLAALPEHLRTVFVLKHWAGLPEASIDMTDSATIAHIMGVSDRTVRNYLSRAEQLLGEWREDQ